MPVTGRILCLGWIAFVVVIIDLLSGNLVASEDRSDPASLCPDSTRFFLRLDSLSEWRNAPGAEPVLADAERVLRTACPWNAWERAKASLGVDSWTLFNRYFGTTVAVVSDGHPRKEGIVILSRAAKRDLDAMPEAFGLKPAEGPAEDNVFRYYLVEEGDVRLFIAICEGWLFVAEQDNSAKLEQFLSRLQNAETGSSLAANPTFLDLTRKLPESRIGSLYTQDMKGFGRHMATLKREGRDLVVHYAGTDPVPDSARQITAVPASVAASLAARKRGAVRYAGAGLNDPVSIIYPFLGQSEGLDLGPLPQSVIGVTCYNAMNYCPQDLGILDLPIVFGNVRKRIIPGVSPPILGVIGSVDVDAGGKKVTVPYAGIMVKLADSSVSHYLDKLIGTLHFLATLGSFQLGKSFFGISQASEGQAEFKIADFGSTLVRSIRDRFVAALANQPDPSGLRRISYGRIGEWYVICTHEAFFRQCVAAYANPFLRFSESEKYREFYLQSCKNLLLTTLVDVPRLAGLLAVVMKHLEEEAGRHSLPCAPIEPGQEKKGEKPFQRLMHYAGETMNGFRDVANAWCYIHTMPAREPKAKDKPVFAVTAKRPGKQDDEPPETDPECALKPLKWLSDTLRKRYSFTFQIWRSDEGTPRGELRIVTGEGSKKLISQTEKRAPHP